MTYDMDRKLKILTLNVRSTQSMANFNDLYRSFMAKSLDIMLLQEAFLSQERASELMTVFPLLKIAVNKSAKRGGVAIILNSLTTDWLDETDKTLYTDEDGRIIVCPIKWGERTITIASVYAPAQAEERLSWLEKSELHLLNHPLRLPCDIIGGDWNLAVNPLDRRSRKADSPNHIAAMSRLIVQLGSPNGVRMIDGWRSHNMHAQAFSFIKRRNGSIEGISRIDYLHVREDWAAWSSDWDIADPWVATDHRAVSATLQFPPEMTRGSGRFRLHADLLKRKKIVAICWNRLLLIKSTIGEDFENCSPEDLLREWMAFKKDVELKIRQVVGTELMKRHRKRTLLGANLEQERRPLKDTHLIEKGIMAIEVEEEEGMLHDLENADHAANTAAMHITTGEEPTKRFFAQNRSYGETDIEALRQISGDARETDLQGIIGVITEYYTELYREKTPELLEKRRTIQAIQNTLSGAEGCKTVQVVSSREVATAIRRSAGGKSPGLDGLPVELYKVLLKKSASTGAFSLTRFLAALYNSILGQDTLPSEWTEGILVTLWNKKGDRLDIKNYRPLTLMNVDYKILTLVLMERLVQALATVIGTHQTAFLPGRLIDDNIRLVQLLIDKYKDSGKPFSMIFLDQEKAYDRVSHEYLRDALEKLGLPPTFIHWIRLLYKGAGVKPFVNGHLGDRIEVRSGVRQGDPISCPLFIAAIEGLAGLLAQEKRIQGAEAGDEMVKHATHANDIWVGLREQGEVNYLLAALDTYCKASGARFNWDTSYLLTVSGPALNFGDLHVKTVSPQQPYSHLGIPVGTDTTSQEEELWLKMVQDFASTAAKWLQFHLPMTGRVLVANALMASLTRYATRFLEMPIAIRKQLEREYFRLVWDDLAHIESEISNLYACAPWQKGGMGCQDFEVMMEATTLATALRAQSCLHLAWAKLTSELLISICYTQPLHTYRVTNPWIQWLGQRNQPPDSIAWVWKAWINRAGHRIDQWIKLRAPESRRDVLDTPFFYHPQLSDATGQGRRTWETPSWMMLSLAGASRISDILDIHLDVTRLPTSLDEHNYQPAIGELMKRLPPDWTSLLHGYRGRPPSDEEDRADAPDYTLTVQGEVINCWGFQRLYEKLLSSKLDEINMEGVTEDVCRTANHKFNLDVTPERLWTNAKALYSKHETADLVWRLLHNMVSTGTQLTWIAPEAQLCPIDCEDLTKSHIWIDCTVAQSVWDEAGKVWDYLKELDIAQGRAKETVSSLPRPTSESELLAMLLVSPYNGGIGRRWMAIVHTALWTLWKAYLSHSHSFPSTEKCWAIHIDSEYQQTLVMTILREGAMAANEAARSETMNPKVFMETWGQGVRDLGISGVPYCISRPSINNCMKAAEEASRKRDRKRDRTVRGLQELLARRQLGRERRSRRDLTREN